jgi:hypothetical protein
MSHSHHLPPTYIPISHKLNFIHKVDRSQAAAAPGTIVVHSIYSSIYTHTHIPFRCRPVNLGCFVTTILWGRTHVFHSFNLWWFSHDIYVFLFMYSFSPSHTLFALPMEGELETRHFFIYFICYICSIGSPHSHSFISTVFSQSPSFTNWQSSPQKSCNLWQTEAEVN